MYWSVPRMWEGKTVAILASGESMSQRVADKVHAAGLPTITINRTFRLAPWADMLYAADAGWWLHRDNRDAHKFAGLKVTGDAIGGGVEVLRLRNTGRVGFDSNPENVRTGGNGGYQALHVAIQAGARQVLLFGYDMHGKHWHGPHPEPLRNAGESIYERWLRFFPDLVPVCVERHVEVLNCTPDSCLTVWPFVPMEEALAACECSGS